MEETLGKRIVHNRKRLGLTQDALAERLGVTAQAVSKWENDQSCPDITTLPRLAEIFGISTDALLGLEKPVKEVELVTENAPGLHVDREDNHWEFKWDGGRKSHMGFGIWVICAALMLLAANYLNVQVSLWTALWTTALAVFGIFGLWPKFSAFRLGCGLLGCYFIANELIPHLVRLEKNYLLPFLLLILGLRLLAEAAGKSGNPILHFSLGENGQRRNHYDINGETFDCSVAFAEREYPVDLPRLSRGTAEVSFGDLTLDLTGCKSFAENCTLDLNCSFGELTVLIPGSLRMERSGSSNFAELNVVGNPAPDAEQSIRIHCDVNFGEIELRYV